MSGEAADPLVQCLARYAPRTKREERDVQRVAAVAAGGGAWERSRPLHVTASALVVHVPTRRVLLRWHERQRAWIQVGGHGDPGESDPVAVARREAAEETGLTDLVPWPSAELRHLVIVPVPAKGDEAAHHHGDLRYVFATERPGDVRPERPGAGLRWLSFAEATELTTEENVRETLARVAALLS